MLKLQNISLSFGEQPVLQNISLTLSPGERIALTGPSGCGKTTLLRVAAGLQKAGSGSRTCTFQNPTVLFQEPRLLPWRTAFQNVALVSDPEKAEFWLDRLGLLDAKGKYPAELSGGMQQRLSLARALARGGDLFLLDEPFKAMDPALCRNVMDAVAEATKGSALLLITHNPEEAAALNCHVVPFDTL